MNRARGVGKTSDSETTRLKITTSRETNSFINRKLEDFVKNLQHSGFVHIAVSFGIVYLFLEMTHFTYSVLIAYKQLRYTSTSTYFFWNDHIYEGQL